MASLEPTVIRTRPTGVVLAANKLIPKHLTPSSR